MCRSSKFLRDSNESPRSTEIRLERVGNHTKHYHFNESHTAIIDLYPNTPEAHHLPALRESVPRPDRHPEHFRRPVLPRLRKRFRPLAIPRRFVNQRLPVSPSPVNLLILRLDVVASLPRTKAVQFPQRRPYSLLSSSSLRTSFF